MNTMRRLLKRLWLRGGLRHRVMKVLLKWRIAGKPIDAKVYYRKTVEIDN